MLNELRTALLGEVPPVLRTEALIGLLQTLQMVQPLLGSLVYSGDPGARERMTVAGGSWPVAAVSCYLAEYYATVGATGG